MYEGGTILYADIVMQLDNFRFLLIYGITESSANKYTQLTKLKELKYVLKF
jgi:hypothetical protein